jgi:hypothetical protein
MCTGECKHEPLFLLFGSYTDLCISGTKPQSPIMREIKSCTIVLLVMYVMQHCIHSYPAHICSTVNNFMERPHSGSVMHYSRCVEPSPFLSCPSKKQLHVCGTFGKKVTVVKGTCLLAVDVRNAAI